MRNSVDYKSGNIILIDQTLLPEKYQIVKIVSWQECFTAIKTMVVRGAPAIGVTGALGVVLGAISLRDKSGRQFQKQLAVIAEKLISSRPTAVNLRWGVERMLEIAQKNNDQTNDKIIKLLEKEGRVMINEDIEINRAIGKQGAKLFKKKLNVLTHCNAGSLATVGYGTALGVIRAANNSKRIKMVYADETRPRLQGGKLTAWELVKEKIPVTVISDNMAGYLMQQGKIDLIVVGADRIAMNGDACNKIGTYSVSVLAKEHKVPFYIAAPLSTIDQRIKSGSQIPIEERDHREMTHVNDRRILARGIKVINPAFDVTPAANIKGIITEKGIVKPSELKKLFNSKT